MFAKVEIHATKTKGGVATTTLGRCIILMRKPAIFGRADVRFCARFRHGQHRRTATSPCDPHYDKVTQGLRQPPMAQAAKTLENLRPGFFFSRHSGGAGLDPTTSVIP